MSTKHAASVSGLLLAAITVVTVGVTTALTTSIVRGELITPLFTETTMPVVTVLLVLTGTTIVLLTIIIGLGFVDGIQAPQLYGYKAYGIMGVSGFIGLFATIAAITASITFGTSIPYVRVGADQETVIALLMTTSPLFVTFIHFLRPSTGRVPNTQSPYRLNDPKVIRDSAPDGTSPGPTIEQRKQREQNHDTSGNRDLSGLLESDTGTDKKDNSQTEESASETTTDKNDPKSVVESLDSEFNWTTETDVSFSDVGGMGKLKKNLRQDVIVPLKQHPEKAEELGVSASNIVLHGPPGTGKTYIAKALATELEMPFAMLSGSNVQSKWINESAEKVATLFEEAEQVAETTGGAIVFLDELDSVLKERTGSSNTHEEDMKVVNEFLNHLEDTDDNNIVFIGATNRIDSLDDAGVRSGRIDKKIHVEKPDAKSRAQILHAQLQDRPNSVSQDAIIKAAQETDGCVASDMELIVKEAAKDVLISGKDIITDEDLNNAVKSISAC